MRLYRYQAASTGNLGVRLGQQETKTLDAKKVAALVKAGKRGKARDANGLYLQIAPTKTGAVAASWVRRYQPPGAEPRPSASGKLRRPDRFMGLGPVSQVSLAAARDHNRKIGELLAQGIDPIQHKREKIVTEQRDLARQQTFGKLAKEFYDNNVDGWSRKHAAQWRASVLGVTLSGQSVKRERDYLRSLREMPAHQIDTPDVLQVLKPLWRKGGMPVTASRLRERIEQILDFAKVSGARTGDNPATFELITLALPTIDKISRVKHFAAIPWQELPTVVTTLRQLSGSASAAVLFAIYTAARTDEVRLMTWDEINWSTATWTVPAERMKADVEHRKPLSSAALALLRSIPRTSDYCFAGAIQGHPLSDKVMLRTLHRIGRRETVHGFRSDFADWAGREGLRAAPARQGSARVST
jgi:integrase